MSSAKVALAALLLVVSGQLLFSQNLTVKTGKDDFDNAQWARLELKAAQPYQAKSGKDVTPVIEILCTVSPNQQKLSVYFFTGLLDPDASFRIKLGDNPPDFLAVEPLADMETQRYFTMKSFSQTSTLTPAELVLAMAKAHTVAIEYAPYLSANRLFSKFDTTGVLAEISKHLECSSQMAGML